MYSKFYKKDTTAQYEVTVPLPAEGWYSTGKYITLGLYDNEEDAKAACCKYFKEVCPIYTAPGETNLGTDVKAAVIYGHEMEIKCLKSEIMYLKRLIAEVVIK